MTQNSLHSESFAVYFFIFERGSVLKVRQIKANTCIHTQSKDNRNVEGTLLFCPD